MSVLCHGHLKQHWTEKKVWMAEYIPRKKWSRYKSLRRHLNRSLLLHQYMYFFVTFYSYFAVSEQLYRFIFLKFLSFKFFQLFSQLFSLYFFFFRTWTVIFIYIAFRNPHSTISLQLKFPTYIALDSVFLAEGIFPSTTKNRPGCFAFSNKDFCENEMITWNRIFFCDLKFI